MVADTSSLPVIDLAPLRRAADGGAETASAIRDACREHGFFYVVGHGVNEALQGRLEDLSRRFFAQDLDAKMAIRMSLGGRAWRGYFAVGDELTLGKPDQKEGVYFGAELADEHPKVAAGVPLHGANLFPDIAGFRETVLDYLDALTALGQTILEGIGLSLGLERSYFVERYTRDPLILFRIFSYPPLSRCADGGTLRSVGEHTDYGLLTILGQDASGGLQVKTAAGWIDAPPIPGSFVCNIGDMLDRTTGGFYRSTLHRVLNRGARARLSFPFFLDPGFDADVCPITPAAELVDDRDERWDGSSVHGFEGSYGEYLLSKVSKVFPELGGDVL